MNNQRTNGVCAYCHEESERLFTPPLIQPDRWEAVMLNGASAEWHCPGEAYPGTNSYTIIVIEGVRYLRGYETPDDPICWECFAGHLSPSELEYTINKPAEIKFNGWRSPDWIGQP